MGSLDMSQNQNGISSGFSVDFFSIELGPPDRKSLVRQCLSFCTARWPMNQLNKNPNIA